MNCSNIFFDDSACVAATGSRSVALSASVRSLLAVMASVSLFAMGCGDDFERDMGVDPDVIAVDALSDVHTGPGDAPSDDVPLPTACTADHDCTLSAKPCERNTCLPSGACAIALLADGAPCDDGDACTKDDRCKASTCQPGASVCPCDTTEDCAKNEDGNACNGTLYCDHSDVKPACKINPATVVTCKAGSTCSPVTCNEASGECEVTPAEDGLPCDDGVACTADDACVAGSCSAKKNVCACQTTADCADQDDGNLCNGTLYCDNTALPHVCKVNPATTVTCAKSTNPCQTVACTPKTGTCVTKDVVDGTACDDGDPCSGKNGADGCLKGTCKPGPPTCSCKADADCKSVEDGDLCNGTLYCDTSKPPFTCKVNPQTVVSCDTSVDTVCSTTQCDPKTGVCAGVETQAGTLCSDDDPCTAGDACEKGSCASGKNTCACKSDADCGQFEDGNLCNGTLYCDKSAPPFVCKVVATSIVQCNPSKDSACIKATCAPKTGACQPQVIAEDTPCDADGNPCTVKDACKGGTCEAGQNTCECIADKDCAVYDDANVCNGTLYCDTVKKPFRCEVNPLTVVSCASGADTECTLNQCDSKTGKCSPKPLPNGVRCNADNNVCTSPDLCLAGACKTGPATCQCTTDADCSALVDPCAGEAFCDKSKPAFLCAIQPNSATICDLPAGKSTACAAPQCVVKGGKPECEVLNSPLGTPCNDGLAWTIADKCNGTGTCSGEPGLVCSKHADCLPLDEDANLCNGGINCVIPKGKTVGACQPVTAPITCTTSADPCKQVACHPLTGLCLPGTATATLGQPCDDGNPCTTSSACQGDGCTWSKAWKNCDDGNICTKDSCDTKKGCTHQADDGRACTDGDNCTQGDTCKSNKCVSGLGEKNCSDGNPCTVDSCGKGVCKNVKITACTTCSTNKDCADGNPCTTETCNANGSCDVLKLQTGSCDDGDKCTDQGTCKGGGCVAPKKSCATTDTCKVGACTAEVGCVKTSKNGGSCDDGNLCTDKDLCSNGACLGTPKSCDDQDPCTLDTCSLSTGKCGSTPVLVTTQCDDAKACTVNDLCTKAGCKGTTKKCSDGKPCTKDVCNVSNGSCEYININGCSGCVSAKDCDDDSACTKDACVNGVCKYTSLESGACDDGQKCTDNGSCKGGKCVTAPKVCKGAGACLAVACNTILGCVTTQANQGQKCDDGDACTTSTTCSGGVCSGGDSKDCSDGKACTLDSCDKTSGNCSSKAAESACDDGNLCTVGACDSFGSCLQVPSNEGKLCTTGGKTSTCKAGNCGACDWWNIAFTPNQTIPIGHLYSVRHLDANTLIFGGDGTTSTGKASRWAFQTTLTGTVKTSSINASPTGDSFRGLIVPKADKKEVVGVSTPISKSNTSGALLKLSSSKGTVSLTKSYVVDENGSLNAIDERVQGQRWVLAGTKAKISTKGWLAVVDNKGKEKHSKTLGDGTGLNTCKVLGGNDIVAGGYKMVKGEFNALAVGYDEKLKYRWEVSPSTSKRSIIFGSAKSMNKRVVFVGAASASASASNGRAAAWALHHDKGNTVWSWMASSDTTGELYGVWSSSKDGGAIAVGHVITGTPLKPTGLLVRLDNKGKLQWRREVKFLSHGSLRSIDVLGSSATATGITTSETGVEKGWGLRFGIDGTLYCK